MKRKVDTENIFERLYHSFIFRTKNAFKANNWLEAKKLSFEKTGIGYNSGQFHPRHPDLVNQMLEIGYLWEYQSKHHNRIQAYYCFGDQQMIFPLRDEKGFVVNFCGVKTENDRTTYLNDDGIYPNFPHPLTKRLYVTETLLDAATVIEMGTLKKDEAVMALYDGEIKTQHKKAISALIELQEIIYIDAKIEL
jgi:hypothetical protein